MIAYAAISATLGVLVLGVLALVGRLLLVFGVVYLATLGWLLVRRWQGRPGGERVYRGLMLGCCILAGLCLAVGALSWVISTPAWSALAISAAIGGFGTSTHALWRGCQFQETVP